MSKKLYSACVPLLAVVAFAIAPAVAQAAPHWYVCEAKTGGKYHDADCTEKTGGNFELKRLPFTGAKTAITSKGTLTLHDTTLKIEKVCKVKDAGSIWNTALGEPGKDEVTEFKAEECTSAACPDGVTDTLEKLPYPSELTEAVAGTIRDKITGITDKLICKTATETIELTYTGTLEPRVVNNSPTHLVFNEAAGKLKSNAGTEAFISGEDATEGPSGESVQAFNP